MLLQFFKHANGKFILLIFLFILLLRTGMALFLELDILMVVLAFVLHSTSAVFINRIFTKNLITKKYSILPAFIFLLLTSTEPFISFNGLTITFLLFCLALVSLSNIYPAERVNERLFNAGLVLSVSVAINPSIVLLTFPLIFIFQVIYDASQIRRVFVSLTALSTPLIIYFSFLFIIFNDTYFIDQILQAFKIEVRGNIPNLYYIVYPTILSVLSLFDLQSHFQHKKILSRKFMLLTLLLGLLHISLITTSPTPTSSGIFILFPITLLIANYFEHVHAKWIHHLLFILLIVFSSVLPFLPL